jgi:translocation and assembly module TamB
MSTAAGTFQRPPHAASRPHLGLRVLRGVAVAIGLLLVFVLSVVVGVLVHVGTPVARRVAVAEVNAILAPSFKGRIRIEALGGLGIFGLSKADVTIDDPHGQPVLVAQGARVRIATIAAIRSLLRKKEALTIELSEVSVDTLDVRLDSDTDGQLELAEAFAPKTPSTTPADPNARELRIVIPHIALHHTWAHGQMTGAPLLDVDLDDFHGAFTYRADSLEGDISGAKITARRIANGADVVGSLQAHVRKPSEPAASVVGRLVWEGTAAGIEQSIHASLTDNRVDAVVDVPQAEAANIRLLWSASPIEEPARVHLEAHGLLSSVDVALRAALGQATLDMNGKVSLGHDKTAQMTLDAENVDVHQLAASAPPSRLGLKGEMQADMPADGSLSGGVDLRFLGGAVGDHTVPCASIRGKGSRSAQKVLEGQAQVIVDEPGAPTHLAVHVAPRGPSSVVTFELQSKSDNLQQIPELQHALGGKVDLSATGELDLGNMTVEARLKMHAGMVTQGTTRIATASIDGLARGPVATPHLELAVRSQGVLVGGIRLVSANVNASGSATSPYVTLSTRGPDTPNLDASVTVGLASGVSLDGLRAVLTRAGERSTITARKVTLGGGDLRVDEGRIEGLGEPITATVAMTPGTLRLRASTKALDLARVGRLANLQKNVKTGNMAFDTDLQLARQGATGRATLDLTRVGIGAVTGLNAHVQLALDNRSLVGKAHADASGVGSIDIDAPKVVLADGGALSARSWRNAWGAVNVDANADLARLLALFPPDTFTFEARGHIQLKGHLARDDVHDLTPDLRFSMTTDRLDIAAATPKTRDIDGVIVYPLPAWHLAGIDFVVKTRMDGTSGLLQLSTQAHDTKGPIAQVDVNSKSFPYADVFQDSAQLTSHVMSTPFDVHLVVPERGLGTLPAILQQHYITGRLAADVKVSGTARMPRVDLTATLRHGNAKSAAFTKEFDLDVAGHYDGQKGNASVKASADKQELLDLQMQAEAAVAQILDADDDSPPRWKATARAHLTSFPLGSISALNDKLISGQLSGDFSLVGLHDDAKADVALSVDALNVGNVAYKSANLKLKADGKILDANLRVDQKDGFAEIAAHAKAAWGAAMAPALDHTQPLDASLSAKNFRLAALLPFVGGALDELDGRLDANTRLAMDPSAKSAQVSGTIALNGGVVEAAAGGGEFHDISASMKMATDGTLTVEKLTARGLSGQLQANGTLHLDGTTLRSAKMVFVIPSHSPIPVSAAGMEIGNVDGRIEVNEATSGDGKTMDVKVEVPHLRVALPEGASANAVALGTMDDVRIGSHRGDSRTFALMPLDPVPAVDATASASSSKLSIETHLGDVLVTRGTELRVDLVGKVNVNPTPGSQVTGQIHLKNGGTLNVEGKTFVVQDGTVTFVGGDPSNPEIVVKANYTASDGTIVIATFDGPLRTGKVTLASEPTLPQSEIVQLLVFGSPDGNQGGSGTAPSESTTNSAIGTAGGEAAQPLNHALSQLGLGAVTANIDTSESSNPKPEVQVQIARGLSVMIAVVLGQPPPGVNPDHTLFTLDWRFLSLWSLATTVGDAGTTIFDILWQRRY